MKVKLTFIFFACMFQVLQGQAPFNRAYHDNSEVPYPYLKNIDGDYYFFANAISAANYGQVFLYKHSQAGRLIFKKQILSSKYREITGCLKTADHKLLLMGHGNPCDVIDSTIMKSFLTKLDTNGTVMFDVEVKTAGTQFNGFIDNFKFAVQHTDSSYYLFTDSVIYHFSKQGQYILKTIGLGINNISSAALLSNSNLLLSGKVGASPKLIEVTTAGSIIAQAQIPSVLNKLSIYGSQKIIGINSSVYKFSPSYILVGTSNLPAGEIINDFEINNDTIFSISSISNTPVYRMMDTNFVSVSQNTTSTQRVWQSAISETSGFIGVLSNCKSDAAFQANNSFVGLNVFSKNQSNNFQKDLAVVSVISDSSYSGCGVSLVYTLCTAYLRAGVWVKNRSQNTVNSLKLNCYLSSGVACGDWYYQKEYSGLAILPGDSVKLIAGWMSKTNMANVYGFTATFCIYSTLPDSTNDKNISNDGKCHSVTLDFTGIHENTLQNLAVDVFPNPSGDFIHVKSSEKINSLQCYDISGRLVKTLNSMELEKSISVEEFDPGIYFLKIETGDGMIVTRRIIKN